MSSVSCRGGAVSCIRRTAPVASGTNGFTLLELLVVLAIVGAIAAVVAPAFFMKSRPPQPEIVQFLEASRQTAIEQATTAKIVLVDGQLRATVGDQPFELPEGQRLQVRWPPPSYYLPEQRVATFYPDGTSVLGEFDVVQNTGRIRPSVLFTVTINPFHGEITYAYP